MIDLAEKYRPATLSEVIGQDRAVKALAYLMRQGLGGRKLWFAGPSGAGKTTLARIAAASIADPFWVIEYDSADDFLAADLDSLRRSMTLTAGGKGGRAWIINEAHGFKAPIQRQLLGVLERVPAHVLIIATTTWSGQEALFDGIDGGPLLSRFTRINLTNQGLSDPFAQRFAEVAAAEGFDVPPGRCKRLVQENKNNLRACYEWLGSAESMDFLQSEAIAA